MLLLSTIMLAMMLAVAVQYVDGNQKIVYVISYDEDSITSGEDHNSDMCCVYGNCSCNSLDHALANLTSNVLINITTDVMLSSLVRASDLENVSIIGHDNPTVNCKHVGGIHFTFCNNCIIQGITWDGCGTENVDNYTKPGLKISNSTNVTIQRCAFTNSIGQAIALSAVSGIVNIHDCNFANNSYYTHHGAAIHYTSSRDTTNQCSQYLSISNCSFTYNEGNSLVYIKNSISECNNNIIVFNCSNFCHNRGVSIYVVNQKVSFYGNILFQNNKAENGAGIYISDHSTVTYGKNACVKFIQNSANYKGGSVFLRNHSSIIFDHNSIVTFNNNSATIGTVYSDGGSNVMFKANCHVTFSGNSATQLGAAICSSGHSYIVFTGHSNVVFNSNVAHMYLPPYFLGYESGCIISSSDYSYIMFEENSTTLYSNNYYDSAILSFNHSHISFKGISKTLFSYSAALFAGGIYSYDHSNITFEENSTTMFNNNSGYLGGGAIISFNHSHLSFKGFSNVFFCDNTGGAILNLYSSTISFSNNTGGAILSLYYSSISFEESSTTLFNNNSAAFGGAISSGLNSSISFKSNCNVIFDNNKAYQSGGAVNVYYDDDWYFIPGRFIADLEDDFGSESIVAVSFFEFANVTFTNNIARDNGGAVYCDHCYSFIFKGNSVITFSRNKATDGGAIHVFSNIKITFKENSRSVFINNVANQGGVIVSRAECDISFMGNSTAVFTNNTANNGAIFYLVNSTTLTFNDSAMITFTDNKARQNGGVFYSMNTSLLFNGNSTVSLAHNEVALNGGVMYCGTNSNISFSEFTNVTFESNNAMFGGAICLNINSNIAFKDNSTALFKNNIVINDGGAIIILANSSIIVKDNTTIIFTTNNAAQYGGAMFFDVTHTTLMLDNERDISFISNTARIAGHHMYFDSTGSDTDCLNNRIVGIKQDTKHFIATPPNKLNFSAPATCIDYESKTAECKTYYLKHIMLGEEINTPVCVLNYCNQPSYLTAFLLQGLQVSNQSYSISGPNQMLLSCGTFQGIRIIDNDGLSNSPNYTINIMLHDDRNPDWKQVSVNLTVELTSCYPGFWQYPTSQKCECYNASDIVFCSGSSSTIRRGYWFGNVNGKPTVTICPINYCNFTCCETSNGYYHLSPVRDDQCRSHRSGTACGSCTVGYTLSFDSPECVNVENCTAGQKVLVILLTLIYWIVMITLVFAMMYYKVPIGYLYSITYYYSIVDILLSQNLQASRGLYLTVSIMSSFSKITPQFLGELCLTTGMSGIDQQFIHFLHPSAVMLILIIISLSARSSRRISAFISRGIIHVICLLVLLSYTSVTSTSLLLMRPLKFLEIDRVYTYVSPDIEYFHGRHLPYGIVALICAVFIAIGLPFLLTFEPFLNHKFNFTKIKPLLDQFQGCYKDKYRCFAGYYMICRLLIMTIVIVDTSNNAVISYSLITACGIIDLIHLLIKPYNNKFINQLDGVILHIIIFISALPLFDDFRSPLVITLAFILLFLPLLIFIVMTLYLHKNDFQKLAIHLTFKNESLHSNDVDSNETHRMEYHLVVGNTLRQKATVCDM